MKLYLAGINAGNINPVFQNEPIEAMKIFLAGLHADNKRANSEGDFSQKICVLESYQYIKPWMYPYIQNHWHFLLDSGAFTFFGNGVDVSFDEWKKYVHGYAEFINKHGIELFIELDIDNIIGIEKTRELRELLERLTGKKSIPVWRPFRGIDYWREMITEYKYVAISASGGYDSAWTRKPSAMAVLYKMIREAQAKGCKVHGLGYTSIDGLERLRWDSVDSTAWLYGNRSGFIYKFNGKNMDKVNVPKGARMKSTAVAVHNFREWVKFQRYADEHL